MAKLAEKYGHQMEFIQYFLDLYDIGTSVYTGTESINTQRESMGGGEEMKFIEPASCFDCAGHPSDIVCDPAVAETCWTHARDTPPVGGQTRGWGRMASSCISA